MRGDMHRIALLAALCSVPVLAAADTVRRGGIPKPYWSVSETPSQTGPNYSARLECSPASSSAAVANG
jgi:hypothetical protein